jgi:hypothetical protein
MDLVICRINRDTGAGAGRGVMATGTGRIIRYPGVMGYNRVRFGKVTEMTRRTVTAAYSAGG